MKEIELRNGVKIPGIGLGTWKITDKDQLMDVIRNAWESGYRLFDTAAAYSNEIALGRAFREIVINRNELFIQDKLWTTCYGYEAVQAACKKSLRKLKMDYLDSYLVHWPAGPGQFENWQEINADTWRGMEKLYEEGYVRTIGVCNFEAFHLEELRKTANILPFINQIEFHPGTYCPELLSYCSERGIQLEGSSPLGNGCLLGNILLNEMAGRKGITVAQLCIAWIFQHGCIAIPKTVQQKYMIENIGTAGITLSDDEMEKINRVPFMGKFVMGRDGVIGFEKL